jgi:Mg2+/Co2+ transporter CorC
MEEMEDIPQEGEKFEFGGFVFTVSKADKRSVIEVVAKRLPRSETIEENERLR